MTWATYAIERLRAGETVSIRPRGNSMHGKVESGQVVDLEAREPEVDDIVLVRCHGTMYLHLVKAQQGDRFLIGNNRGKINGWVNRDAIYGVATRIYEK